MILISNSFKTDNKKLAALYESAKNTLVGSVAPFGDYNLGVVSHEANKITLDSEVMSAETLARFDVGMAMECVKAFERTQREDGRLACEIVKKQEGIFCDYSRLAGFALCEEALSLFYMTKKKEFAYLDGLYAMLERLDDYLWGTHDKNGNGYLELLDEKETVEGRWTRRYSPAELYDGGNVKEVSPFPAELAIMSGFAYTLKKTLAEISELAGDGRADFYRSEADKILKQIAGGFWNEEKHACFDRNFKGGFMTELTLDTLYMMYHGVLEPDMAETFLKEHLLNKEEFYTELPFPYLPISSPEFENDNGKPYGGQVRGDSYMRAVKALEKYGYCSELTEIARKFLDKTAESMTFTELYDPFTGAPQKEKICADYAPSAAAVLEMIARLYGITLVFDELVWGALGHEGESTSEFNFKWGGDLYTLESEKDTGTGYINGKLLFSVTSGVRVVTDWFGDNPRVVNITDKTLDCVFVYRNKTYSFTIEPNEVKTF